MIKIKQIIFLLLFCVTFLLLECRRKVTKVLISQTYEIEAYDFKEVRIYLQKGYDISGYFQVAPAGRKIGLAVLDQKGYNKWLNDEGFFPIIPPICSDYGRFSFKAEETGFYYFILDNAFEEDPTDISVFLRVEATYYE